MSRTQLHKPHHPEKDVPEEFEPGAPPVEPDEGPVPAFIPEDPEHERAPNPGANETLPIQGARREIELVT
ncbi:MAG: hypothetical protein CVU22_03520 [Betaproteobacteria bacterium HGW-Betaproteobacteria-16]|nr:MAG: hypothetical protein CVU22_03520 [Betaproteobacteria bacterium HGW-Betaproteobacteria-16]